MMPRQDMSPYASANCSPIQSPVAVSGASMSPQNRSPRLTRSHRVVTDIASARPVLARPSSAFGSSSAVPSGGVAAHGGLRNHRIPYVTGSRNETSDNANVLNWPATTRPRTAGAESAEVVIVMGVAGSGKTTVGLALAAALGWRFVDADAHHAPEERGQDGARRAADRRRLLAVAGWAARHHRGGAGCGRAHSCWRVRR